MKRFFSFLIVALFASCFHKDVITDAADDVADSFVYSGTEGTFIILKEEIFQATSKKSGGGMTSISGYAEYRLSSYDLKTGDLLGRVNMGEGQEKAFIIMGTTAGKIWCYSKDEELGLHCRNAKTLELISAEKDLITKGALKGFAFARPEWSRLNDFYSWDASNGKLMLSDMQDFHYYFDPEKDQLEKTENEIKNYKWSSSPYSSNVYLSENDYFSLQGTGRQKLKYQYADSTGQYSYLNGNMLLECNPIHLEAIRNYYRDSLAKQISVYLDSLNQLLNAYPEFAQDNHAYYFSSDKKYQPYQRYQEISRIFNNLQSEQKKAVKIDYDPYKSPALTDSTQGLFVIHASDVSDTARFKLTLVSWSNRKFLEQWTLAVPGLYADPDKADTKGAFETVMSEGNPDYSYQWFDIHEDHLVFVWQLQLICIDTKAGKVLWQKPL
jgi:hypothetical protein